jgi:hypothetical protein
LVILNVVLPYTVLNTLSTESKLNLLTHSQPVWF